MRDGIVVTGAAGFVGSHLLRLLSERTDAELVAWRRAGPGGDRPPRPSPPPSRVRWVTVDLLDAPTVDAALAECQPRQIYHLAGVAGVHASWDNVVPTLEGNVRATDNLLSALRPLEARPRVLIPGSALVYRPAAHAIDESDPLGPVSPYAVSKLAQEMLAQQHVTEGADVVLTRSFTHVGPGQEPSYAASSFAEQIAHIETGDREPVLKVGFLGAVRDLLDVRDTIRAYVALMEHGTAGQPYNVCSGQARAIGDVLDELLRLARVPVRVEQEATRLRPRDNERLVGSPDLLQQETGWKPTIPLETTVAELLDYWRSAV